MLLGSFQGPRAPDRVGILIEKINYNSQSTTSIPLTESSSHVYSDLLQDSEKSRRLLFISRIKRNRRNATRE